MIIFLLIFNFDKNEHIIIIMYKYNLIVKLIKIIFYIKI